MSLEEFRRKYPAQTMTLGNGKPFTYRYYRNPEAAATVVLLTGGIGLSDLFYRHFEWFAGDFSVLTFDYQIQFADNGEFAGTVAELLRRPEITYDAMAPVDPSRPELDQAVQEQVEIQVKYAGYLARQLRQVEEFAKAEARQLPPDTDYAAIAGLRLEAREKLSAIRPVSIGQASRISGVSPADIAVLLIWLEQQKEQR